MPLSFRLKKIVELLEPVSLLLDVGCDHAYASIEAIETGRAKEVLACDVRTGPLKQAQININNTGLASKISVLLSDGIREIIKNDLKPDGLIIAGMGGQLMLDILKGRPTDGKIDIKQEETSSKAAELIKNMRSIVLSPQSEPELVRHYIVDELRLEITDEINICDEGKYYTVIKVDNRTSENNAAEPYPDEIFYKYGFISCKKREPVFIEGLKLGRSRYEQAIEACKRGSSQHAQDKLSELTDKIKEIDYILNNEAGL